MFSFNHFSHINNIIHICFFSSYCLSGPIFIQPSDINNRDHLIVASKCSYEREIIKRDGPSTQIFLNNVQGKCSVLSLKHFCTRKFYHFSIKSIT